MKNVGHVFVPASLHVPPTAPAVPPKASRANGRGTHSTAGDGHRAALRTSLGAWAQHVRQLRVRQGHLQAALTNTLLLKGGGKPVWLAYNAAAQRTLQALQAQHTVLQQRIDGLCRTRYEQQVRSRVMKIDRSASKRRGETFNVPSCLRGPHRAHSERSAT